MQTIPEPRRCTHLLYCLLTFFCTGCASHQPVSTIDHPEAALVRLHAPDQIADAGARSGFIASGDGVVVSSFDGGFEKALVTAFPDGRSGPAAFLEGDHDTHVALYKAAPPVSRDGPQKLPFLRLSDADIEPGMHLRVVTAAGVVHGVFDHWENFGKDIDFTARGGLSESGGPILADDGRVIGVVQHPVPQRPGEYLATPIWRVLRMMPRLKN